MASKERFRFVPKWRARLTRGPFTADDEVTVLEHETLASIALDSAYLHDGERRRIVRFVVTDSGRILAGDAWSVLHKDICSAFEAIDGYTAFVAGVAILPPGEDAWEVRLQPFDTRDAPGLLSRLTTWIAFTEGTQHKIVPYGIADV